MNFMPVLRYPAVVPYRIDIASPPDDALDQLVQLGALDIEPTNDGLAIIPDGVSLDSVVGALGAASVAVSPAVGRDDGSIWLLNMRAVRIGSFLIAPPEVPAAPGVLALIALMKGVPRAVGLDIDADALNTAAEHARMNNMKSRLDLVLGGPDAVNGAWPLVVANMLAAPLMELAPVLVRRVGSRGRLILSGIPWSLESEVRQTYEWLGMRHVRSEKSGGWSVVVVQR